MHRNDTKTIENYYTDDTIGKLVFEFLPWIEKEKINAWVSEVASCSRQSVHWQYCNGRVRIYGEGDLSKIQSAIKYMLVSLNEEIYAYCKAKFSRKAELFDPTFSTKTYTEADVNKWFEQTSGNQIVFNK